jgi:cyclopropane-fatty-acyl-phospholipid synthase
MSLYRQAFWKLLELGLIPDYYVRSKVRNGLIDQIKDMNQDGNVETAQENLNKFIEEIKTMPIAINQSNANDQHYEVPSEFYVKVLGSYLKYSCGLWPNDDTTLEESELEMLKLYCQRADLKKGIFSNFSCMFLNPNNFFQFVF